ncbi:MAG: hypothetical protein RMJ28_06940 [Nitrososphaerota archaeon]|nr:hypothetical protein [Candidatus Calditenuaceae archaeon]MDW8073949.1 hypothetical protein [Nitrososphaerota archaeon]
MELRLLGRAFEGAAAGAVYGFAGYLRSRSAGGEALRLEGIITAVLWGFLAGLLGGALGLDFESAENILLDLGVLVLVKKLGEAALHSPPVRRVWAR